MTIAIDPAREWDFITKDDLAVDKETKEPKVPEADRTTFHLRALSPRQLADVTDMGMQQDQIGGKVTFRTASQVVAILTCGLVGWSNLKDRKGQQVAPPEDPMDRIALLPEAVRVELAHEIRYRAELTAAEGN